MSQKIGTYTYKVEPFDADFRGQLSCEVLGKRILSAASFHAGERGFEKLEVNGVPYLWVLSRLVIQMDRWPKIGETYSVATWIRSYFRYFTDRCFDILDEKGNKYGQVLSIWAMINSQNRQPADITTLFGDMFDQYFDLERPFNVERSGHFHITGTKAVDVRKAYYSDLDTNGHVNSIRYIEFLLDAFPKSLYETADVERIEMEYSSESYAGDTLDVFLDEIGENRYVAEIRKRNGLLTENGTVAACKCAVTFKAGNK